MPVTVDTVFADAMTLPDDARAELVDRLLADAAPEVDPELERIYLDVAKKRRDAIRSGIVQPIPGPEALRRVRERLTR